MAIKHLGWSAVGRADFVRTKNPSALYTSKELKQKDNIPFWKKREMLMSPFIIFIGIGYAIYFILYATYLVIKWILFAWISPFIYSKMFCKMGFHKYRALDKGGEDYKCLICQKKMHPNFL